MSAMVGVAVLALALCVGLAAAAADRDVRAELEHGARPPQAHAGAGERHWARRKALGENVSWAPCQIAGGALPAAS